MKNQSQLLAERIQILEMQQEEDLLALKHQFHLTIDSLSPMNYIKNSLHEMTTSPDMKTDLLNGVAGLASGYLAQKVGLFGLARAPLRGLINFIGRKLF